MRKVVVLEHITLDGVIQAPGTSDEDTSGGFIHGGWIASYSDPVLGKLLRRQMNGPFDLLLGRNTYELWAQHWPNHADAWPAANNVTKYVASNTLTNGTWQPAEILSGDVAHAVHKLKDLPGPDLHVWGSSQLLQTLFQSDLVDRIWLMMYPLVLGGGKRLFDTGTLPASFKVTESQVTPAGIFVVTYDRAGDVVTGNL